MNALLAYATGLANAGLAFFYAEYCQLCSDRRALRTKGFVCEDCFEQVRWIVPPYCDKCGYPYPAAITTTYECGNCAELDLHFSSARSAVAARTGVLEAIHRYKYQRALWFEPFLAELLVRQAMPDLANEGWTRVVPVPLHALKLREREFNQSERIARHLAEALALPLSTRLLARVKPTLTQTRLSREQRRSNVHNAFELRAPANLAGERVILVDDVFTTGATTDACAKVLREAGAAEVCVWTVARGI